MTTAELNLMSERYRNALTTLQDYCDANELDYVVEKSHVEKQADPYNVKLPGEAITNFINIIHQEYKL